MHRALPPLWLAAALSLGAAIAGCEPSSISNVTIAEWCVSMETALRDRHVRCECPGEAVTDAEIETRCAALDAASFLALYDEDAIGWNGAIATARVDAIDSCDDPALFLDDPVLGNVPAGSSCQVFEDVWGGPDDCVHGARCMVPLGGGEATCVELVGEGESCEPPRACEPGLTCDGGTCTPVPTVPEVCPGA